MKTEELKYAMAIGKVFNYRCSLARKLIEVCGGLEDVFRMERESISEMLGGQETLAAELFDDSLLRWAEDELEWARNYGVRILCRYDESYPQRLVECDDAPIILYTIGEADLNAKRMLSVVGTRKATYYGKNVCKNIIDTLSANPEPPTIVSGLAFGIDGTAHRAALDAGIPTIAVLPTGLDCIYPSAHRDLAKLIIQSGGALLTDFSRNASPTRIQFIRRNRIIAGISDATLLVESCARGGGLITTNLANSYDREVFAVPGRTTDPSSDGCNKLIENNLARLVTGAYSIEKSMGWQYRRPQNKNIPELEFEDDSDLASIVSLLAERSPIKFNSILSLARKPDGSSFSTGELSSLLLDLELSGRLGVSGGNLYELLR